MAVRTDRRSADTAFTYGHGRLIIIRQLLKLFIDIFWRTILHLGVDVWMLSTMEVEWWIVVVVKLGHREFRLPQRQVMDWWSVCQ